MQKSAQFVEDLIVPIIAILESNPDAFRFLGSGLIIDQNGYLSTCKHVVDALGWNENLILHKDAAYLP